MNAASSQGGMATLPITLVLAFAVLLAALFANRSVLVQAQSSGHQVQAIQAQEAAQAGLAWALAKLNRVEPTGEDCLPSDDPGAIAWQTQATLGPLQASCVAQGAGWSCHCPPSGDARPIDGAGAQAFRIQLVPDPSSAGRWNLSATGSAVTPGRTVKLQLRIGRLPGLDTLPAAALSVRGNVDLADGFAIEHHNPVSGGLTLLAGGHVGETGLQLDTTPGTPPAASVVSHDDAFAALTPTTLHASVFRMDRTTWREQPSVRTVDCHSRCDVALRDAARQHALIALDGGLRLGEPITLGSPQRPVLLVVDGPVELGADVVLHGLVYLRGAQWRDRAGASIHGAVIAEGDLHAQGPTRLHHDIAVLQALQRSTGTYAPIAGSWRDL